MTIEEKLEKFYEVSMEHARESSEMELTAYQESLEKIFREHKETAERQNALHLKTERDESRRLSNMEVSKEQLQLKRKLSQKESALTETLFEKVGDKLAAFHAGPEYKEWLIRQIESELAFAAENQIRIYIDPSDEALLPELLPLAEGRDAEICISEERFLGGSRGVIHERNILIDNSLARKLADVKDNYQLREEL